MLISLFISAVLITILGAVASSRNGILAAGVVAAIALVAGLLCLAPAVALQALLLIPVSVGCYWINASQRTFTRASLVASLIAYAVVGWDSYGMLRERRTLQKQFAYRDLSERLVTSGKTQSPRP